MTKRFQRIHPEPETPSEPPAVTLPPAGPVIVPDVNAANSSVAVFTRPPELLETVARDLDVILDAADLATLSRELVDVLGDIEEEVEDQTAQKAAMKERLASLFARQSKLAGTIRRGRQARPVDVQAFADWALGMVTERRADTGEIVATRPMRESEKQLRLTPEVATAAEGAMAAGSEA